MKTVTLTVTSALLVLALAQAEARDTKHMLPIETAMSTPAAKEKLDGSVRFYFAGQRTPKVLKTSGEGVTNRKTNAAFKGDEEACRWVFLSALLALQDEAKSLGANAVIDITSYYKKNEFSSATEYECHAGAIMAGVALKGTYATVASN